MHVTLNVVESLSNVHLGNARYYSLLFFCFFFLFFSDFRVSVGKVVLPFLTKVLCLAFFFSPANAATSPRTPSCSSSNYYIMGEPMKFDKDPCLRSLLTRRKAVNHTSKALNVCLFAHVYVYTPAQPYS